MAQVVPIGERGRGGAPVVHFDRAELCRLLTLYSERVADGEWRDYAIDQQPGRAIFAVYRHSRDCPAFTITKLQSADSRSGWEVASGLRRLLRAATLDEVLTVFRPRLHLVPH